MLTIEKVRDLFREAFTDRMVVFYAGAYSGALLTVGCAFLWVVFQ